MGFNSAFKGLTSALDGGARSRLGERLPSAHSGWSC